VRSCVYNMLFYVRKLKIASSRTVQRRVETICAVCVPSAVGFRTRMNGAWAHTAHVVKPVQVSFPSSCACARKCHDGWFNKLAVIHTLCTLYIHTYNIHQSYCHYYGVSYHSSSLSSRRRDTGRTPVVTCFPASRRR